MNDLRIVAVCGSLRRGSYNRMLLAAAQELLPEGVAIEVADIASLPLYNADLEERRPAAVVAFKEQVRRADALLIATPEYNHSVPGVLKNALDWASSPPEDNVLAGKPLAVIGASRGRLGTARAQMHLREVAVATGMVLVPHPEFLLPLAASQFDAEGGLREEDVRRRLHQVLSSLAAWTRRLAPRA